MLIAYAIRRTIVAAAACEKRKTFYDIPNRSGAQFVWELCNERTEREISCLRAKIECRIVENRFVSLIIFPKSCTRKSISDERRGRKSSVSGTRRGDFKSRIFSRKDYKYLLGIKGLDCYNFGLHRQINSKMLAFKTVLNFCIIASVLGQGFPPYRQVSAVQLFEILVKSERTRVCERNLHGLLKTANFMDPNWALLLKIFKSSTMLNTLCELSKNNRLIEAHSSSLRWCGGSDLVIAILREQL